MKISDVIKEVQELEEYLVDVDGLSGEYYLTTEVYDDTSWQVNFLGHMLLCSEDYDEKRALKDQIIDELKDIQNYLNLTLNRTGPEI